MDLLDPAMTYHFFCKLFKPKIAAWITALWFALLFLIVFALSGYQETPFMYLDF
jgi:hypothetical protein